MVSASPPNSQTFNQKKIIMLFSPRFLDLINFLCLTNVTRFASLKDIRRQALIYLRDFINSIKNSWTSQYNKEFTEVINLWLLLVDFSYVKPIFLDLLKGVSEFFSSFLCWEFFSCPDQL